MIIQSLGDTSSTSTCNVDLQSSCSHFECENVLSFWGKRVVYCVRVLGSYSPSHEDYTFFPVYNYDCQILLINLYKYGIL